MDSQEVLEKVEQKIDERGSKKLIDLVQPHQLTNSACTAFFGILSSKSPEMIVFAASSSYAIYQSSKHGRAFFQYYQYSAKIKPIFALVTGPLWAPGPQI